MSLCEVCQEGQLEMCEYFKEHFLESGKAVYDCPEFRYADNGTVEVLRGEARVDKVRILASRSIRKAMAGERVLMLTAYKTAQAERLLRAIEDSELKEQVASVHVHFKNGGEVWIGGV